MKRCMIFTVCRRRLCAFILNAFLIIFIRLFVIIICLQHMYIKTFLYRSRSCSAVSWRVCSLTFVSIGEKHLRLGNIENFVLQISSKTSLRESGHVFSFALKMLWLFSCSNRINVIKFRKIRNSQCNPQNSCGKRRVMLLCYFIQISSRMQLYWILVVNRWE